MARRKKEVTEVTNNTNIDIDENIFDELRIKDENEKIQCSEVVEESAFYDPDEAKVNLAGLAAASKKVKESTIVVPRNELRDIVDSYYQAQLNRIREASKMRAIEQRADKSNLDKPDEIEESAMNWIYMNAKNTENQIKLMIQEYTSNHPVCQWAMATKGIGPVFAANLWGNIDMSKAKHANNFLSYVGLNDNNTPWLGKDKAEKLVNEVYADLGLDKKAPADWNVFYRCAVKSGRNVDSVERGFNSQKSKAKKNETDRSILIKFLSMPPYNMDLKKTCYLIGESFCKVSNRGSLYGQIYQKRKAWETLQNEQFAYKEQAEKLLTDKKYKTNTDTYSYLVQGKLSPGHINMRAKRYAVKIFLTHFFEACYIYTYKKNPPTIYPIAHQDHVDYIEPEVPYENFFMWDKE